MWKGRKIGGLILLVSLAFVGLLWTQYLWVSNNIEQSNKEFDDQVKTLMAAVIETVEKDDYCIDLFSKIALPQSQELKIFSGSSQSIDGNNIPVYYRYQHGEMDTLIRFDSIYFGYPAEIEMNLNVQFIENEIEHFAGPLKDLRDLKHNFQDTSLNLVLLDSLLKRTLLENGITQRFEYGISDIETSKTVFISHAESEALSNSGLRARLFGNSHYHRPYELLVYFPDKTTKSIASNMATIFSSFALIGMLVLLFVVFFRMMLKERKLSEMKVDFVNNITHEFRTPLSNIKLAANALKKGRSDDSNRLIDIIEEENERLQKGIDLALTTSLLNKDEILLDKAPFDVHEVLTRLANSNQLTSDDQQGDIQLHLKADKNIVMCDELHMTNVLNNLIYNALKYSRENPTIDITTADAKSGLEILIKDNGIGIGSSDLPYIFDRFYRVSTENRHETRGYGIGLYYVKMIVEAHHGRVSVSSTPNVGTTFKLTFPLNE